MTYPLPGVIVDPNGQSTSITITSKTSGQTPTVYSDDAGQNVVSMPKTISAPYTFYLPNPGTWTVGGVDVTLSDDEVATVNLNTTSYGAYVPLPENVDIANSGTAFTVPDPSADTITWLTLTGNCTLTFPTAAAGKSFTLGLVQDATGSRTVTWPAAVKWPGGTAPTLTTTAAKTDVIAFLCGDGTNWLGFVSEQNF